MSDFTPRFQCPECNRGVLNRAINTCLYCGATLSDESALSEQELAEREADQRRRALYAQNNQAPAASTGEASNVGEAIELISDGSGLIEGALDLVGDLLEGASNLLD